MTKFLNISTDNTLGGSSASDVVVASQKAVKNYVDTHGGGGGGSLDAGFVAPFAGSTAPSGWFVCDGSAINRTDYADLFAAIGTTYGVGDGSTTFNLPDLSGRLPLYNSSATLGSTTVGQAPNITGRIDLTGISNHTTSTYNSNDISGSALYNNESISTGRYHTDSASTSGYNRIRINANRCSSVYNDNATGITPAGVYTLWCIKY